MKSRQFVLDEQVTITVSKRASSRRLRLTIGQDGIAKVSIPNWVPYIEAVRFARSKLDWIKSKTPKKQYLTQGRKIGKNHQLVFKPTGKPGVTTRLNALEAIVFYPKDQNVTDDNVQTVARKVIRRALLSQGQQLLPMRLEQLAKKYGYSYSGIKVKSLKTRWGSCDSHQNITLNLYLMELPWELIDYVLLHELNHTVVMQHGPKFWELLKEKLPNYAELRQQLKSYPNLV